MPARPACPTCGKPAYRAYAQVQNPDTHRSTSVAIPAVFCGTAGFANGHGTLAPAKGQHGLVVLKPGAFAAQMRNSRAAVAKLTPSQRKGGKPLAAKKPARRDAKKATKKAPKAAAPSGG